MVLLNRYQTFIDAFKDYSSCYVIIGGTASAANLFLEGSRARATKDYDIVILDEGRNSHFFEVMEKYLAVGNYQYLRSNEKSYLHRFKTEKLDYPPMIEIFSKRPSFLENWPGAITSLSFSEEASLSAIMLDSPYYDFLLQNIISIEEINYLNKDGLIVLKAKAWINLLKDRSKGIKVNSSDIDKHLKDICKLLATYEDLSKITLSHELQKDMSQFIELLHSNKDMIPESRDYPLNRDEVCAYASALLKE